MSDKPLTLDALRKANLARLPLFKDAKGRVAHDEADGSDWRLSGWSNATLGELGEAANLVKKIERGDFELDEVREKLADELADVLVYLDLYAFRAGVDLGAAVRRKWNAKSAALDLPLRIEDFES